MEYRNVEGLVIDISVNTVNNKNTSQYLNFMVFLFSNKKTKHAQRKNSIACGIRKRVVAKCTSVPIKAQKIINPERGLLKVSFLSRLNPEII